MSYAIAFEAKGAYVKFDGCCSYDEVLRATVEVWEHPRFDGMIYEIFDYLSVTSMSATEYDVVEIAVRDSVASKMSRRSKLAVVAKLPSILAMTEDYRRAISDPDLQFLVSDNLKTAREWVSADV